MEHTYWHKQNTDKPLYPELVWSRPENKRQAGKLLIVGGNLHGFAAPAEAYQAALQAGVGTAKVLLPDALKKVVGPIIENGEYAPSTPSGSFSQTALAGLIDLSAWADGVLLAGDLGRNSETAILLEKFLQKSASHISLTKDAADYAITTLQTTQRRPNTALIITMAQLQKLTTALNSPQAITFGMDLLRLVKALRIITEQTKLAIIVKQNLQIICAVSGKVSTTSLIVDQPSWRIKVASQASVWWLQNPTKPFEALTTSIYSSFGNQG